MIIQVWDFPLRLFHWFLVLTIIASYVTSELSGVWLDWHTHLGTFTLALITFRITWGFVGSTYARFSHFIPTPGRLLNYFLLQWNGLGHNPLGALSVFTLLGIILVQACSGLFAVNDEIDFHGPLYNLISSTWNTHLTTLHRNLFDALLFLICLHIATICHYTWIKRKNLIMPMITGNTHVTGDNLTIKSQTPKKLGVVFAAAIAGLVFWSIESGALIQWLSTVRPSLDDSTSIPVW